MRRPVSLFMSLAFAFPCWAQSAEDWKVIKEKFPEEPAVFVSRSEVLNIFVTGDSLQAFSDQTEEVIHLKDQTDLFFNKRVYGSHFNSVENIKARTMFWDRNRYKEIAVKDFRRNDNHSDGIFFDDSYYYSFDFPSVASRSRTILEYRENLKDPRFISGYIFAAHLPHVVARYVIRTTKDVDIFHRVLNDPEGRVRFKKSQSGNAVTYEWVAENVPALKSDDNSPPIRYYAPHVMTCVKSYKTRNGQVRVLSDLDDLHSWYYGFVEKLNKESSPELISIVERLKETSQTELELVKNVFYWVQDNIQYIAFEEGMRGFIPHHGAYVCEKRYGDCKDMANLIVNMLSLAKVTAYHTWIGTRDLPYKYSEFPSPMVDNHMIATYVSQTGEYYFLDATSDHTAFGLPSSMIQGKEALISMGRDKYEIKEVPEIRREKNVMIDSMVVTLQAGQLTGSGICTLSGFAKVFGAAQLDRVEQDDVRRNVNRLVGKGSNKFSLDKYSIADLTARDKKTVISYSFHLPDYFQRIGDEVFLNLNLNKDYYNSFVDPATRTSPKKAEYKYAERQVLVVNLPEGYAVAHQPVDVMHNGRFLGFEIRYQSTANQVIYTRNLYLDYLLLQPDQFEKWNESVTALSEAYKESVILKKK